MNEYDKLDAQIEILWSLLDSYKHLESIPKGAIRELIAELEAKQ